MEKTKKEEAPEPYVTPKPTWQEQMMIDELRKKRELQQQRLDQAARDKSARGGQPPPSGLLDLIVGG